VRVVTLSGMASDNPSRGYGDLNFYVPSERYGWIECAHQVILHYWLDQYVAGHLRK
jgi:D-sedoheptulose 7-phosphate isomerase